MQNPSHSSKRLPTTKNSIYDDVFGRAPRKNTLAPRVEDYAEIFGGFHSSRASSIPFLDLPTTSASSSPPFEAHALSRLEYYDVFGGFDDHDFALSYEEILRMVMRMGGESNGPDGFSSSDTDDAWTMSGSGYLSEESHVKNQCLSNGDSCESIDGDMEFNISYNKAGQRSNEALSNGMTQMHLVPEYSFVVDRGDSSTKTSVGDCQPFELGNGHIDTGVSGELQTGKLFRKTMSQPAYGTAHTSSHGNPLKHQKDYSRNVSFPNEAFLTISDVSLRTRPSNLPPPSRQPPALHVKKMDSGKMRSNTDSLGFEGGLGDSSPPYFDVDVDVDSSAVASAAAMKEAMDKAQAKLKSAKELLAKKMEVNLSSKRLGSKKNGKHKGGKLAQPFDSSGTSDEIFQSTSRGKENRGEFCVFLEKQNTALTTHSSPGSPEGIDQDLNKKSAEDKHGGGSVSSQGSAEMDRAGEWQEATQYYELVKMDKRRKPIDQPKNDNVWVQSTDVHEFEKKGKKATIIGTLQSKLLENIHTFEGASGWDENGKESRANLHAADTENEQIRANKLQSESFDGLLHINNQTEVVNVKQKGRERQLREADLCMKEGTVETQMCLGVVGDDEKVNKLALEHAENARRQRQAFEEEEKRSYGKKQEAFEIEEKEMRHREVLEFEESKRQDGILEKEPNNRKIEATRENSKSERRWKEAVEREENEKREKDVHTRKEKEKRPKETVEKEKERRKRETVEREESEKRQREAREREENEKRVEEILEREKSERRIKDAASREENEKKQRGSHETEEMKMLGVADEKEDTKKRLEDVCEQEEYDNKHEAPPEREGTKKRGEEPFDKEEVQRVIKVLGSKGIGKVLDDANEKEQSLKGSKEGDYEIDVKEACELQESGNITQQYHKQKHGTGNDATLKGPSTMGLNPGAMCSDVKLDRASNLLGTQLKDKSQSGTGQSETLNGKEESMKRLIEMKGGEMDVTSGMMNEMFHEKTISMGMVQGNMGDEVNELPLENSVGLSCTAGDVKKAGQGGIAIEQKNVEEIKIASLLDFDVKKVERERSEKISQESNARGKSTENGQVISNHGDVRGKSGSAKVEEGDEMGKKKEFSYLTKLEVKESIQRAAQHVSPVQVGERKVKNLNATLSSREQESEMMMREKELEQERQRKLEEEREREREREREKDRMAVDGPKFEGRGFSESRERVERATVERMMNEARERLEKACAEAREKSMTDKMAMEARLRAERAAVERATAEARERAFQRAMAERATFEMKDRVEGSIADHLSASSRNGIRPSSSSYDRQDMPSRNAGMLGSLRSQNLSHYSGPNIVERSGVMEGESPQRCKARLERHRRTAERAAKALAEKNMRDLLAQREQAERNRLAETLDADVRRWSTGKEGNLRALLSTLQYILGPDSGWQPVPLTEVITAAAVKKAYRKATLCVHPDKLQQRGASVQQKYICEKVFDLLKEAWSRFNSEER